MAKPRLRKTGQRVTTRLAVESLEKRRLLSADGVAPESALIETTLPGDLDQDGVVGFADFLELSANFGATDALPGMGDIDGDATVGFSDFLILSKNFGRTQSASEPAEPQEGVGQIEVLVNEQNDIVITSDRDILEVAYAVDGQLTKISDIDSKEYTLSVLGVTDLWVKSGTDAKGRDIWEHFVCPTDEVHGEPLAQIDVTVDDQDQINIVSSETITQIIYFVDGMATKIDVNANEYTLDVLNVTDLWVQAGEAENGRDYWEHFICPTDDGHVSGGQGYVPTAEIDVLVNDANEIVISSTEVISEIVYLVDGKVTTISDVDAQEYTLDVLNVTDLWVKSGDSHGRDVWEHFVCPTDEVHGERLAQIDVTVDDQDQINIVSSETITQIIYFVDGMATKIEVNANEYTLDVLNVTDLWVQAGEAENGRDYWEHFICPTDDGHVSGGQGYVPTAEIDVLVNDANEIVISSTEVISEIVYLVDGKVTTISDVDAQEYTLDVLNVTDLWVKSGDSHGRDVWEHFVCPTDEVHGERLAQIDVTVDDQDQINIVSSETITQIIYFVDGMATKIEDVNANEYTLDVLNVTDLWVQAGDAENGRDYWEHFVCPTDEGHGPAGPASVPSAEIEVLVDDQNQIVISSTETISEIVYLVDGKVTTISDINANKYTLNVLGVTNLWVKSGSNSHQRDVWEHFVCPTDVVHDDGFAKIDVLVNDQDQIVISADKTITDIVYVVDGVMTKIADVDASTYTLSVYGVTDIWIRSDHPTGRDFWQHFVCPTDH